MGAQSGKAALASTTASRSICDLCGAKAASGSSASKGSHVTISECSRCHLRCCSNCYAWRRFGSRFSAEDGDARTAEYACVCEHCQSETSLIMDAPRCVWETIVSYCDATSKHRLLQLCHATQMGVVLPYPHVRYGWNTLFRGKHFISKGANGEVYKTAVRSDIAKELANSPVAKLDVQALTDLAGTTVAVKAIRKSTVFSLRKWEHIQREVETLRKCRHRHVVQIHFVAQGPSEVYIALQYVAGGDLFDWLVRQQIPMEYDVVVIARQLMETLHYMHEVCSVVHRDIKPENILLQPLMGFRQHNQENGASDGEDVSWENHSGATDELYIRLADFGYAKFLPRSEPAAPTTTAHRGPGKPPLPPTRPDSHGIVEPAQENRQPLEPALNVRKQFLISSTPCGTIGFAAPEILSAYNAKRSASQRLRANRDPAGQNNSVTQPQTPVSLVKRMDIFAAGVTLCILLTGCEPFPCVSSKEHIDAVQSGLDFSGPQWNYVSHAAKKLLRRMLAPKAADRPSALECLNSSWLKYEGSYTDPVSDIYDYDEIAHGKSLQHSASVWQLLSTSFQNSVHSLRKNEGWLFVQDSQGMVSTIPRQLLNGSEDGELVSDPFHTATLRDQPVAAIY